MGAELAPHVRIILRKDRGSWYIASHSARGCHPLLERRFLRVRRLAVSRLTRRALELMYPKAAVSVRHGRGRHDGWLMVELAKMPRSCNLTEVRGHVRGLMTELGIRYATYDYPPFGRRLRVRMRVNKSGRFRRL